MFAGVSFGAVLLSVVLVSGQGQFYVNNKDQFWGPDQGNWTVEGDCIIAQMAAQVKYFLTQNGTVATEAIPKNATASGSCNPADNTTQLLMLDWEVPNPDPEYANKTLQRHVTITFQKNSTAQNYGVIRIDATIDTQWKMTTNSTSQKEVLTREYVDLSTFALKEPEFKTPVNRSFLCADVGDVGMDATLNLDPKTSPDVKLGRANMTATKVQLDAFRSDDAKKKVNVFQIPLDCAFHPSDVVPIIVGCALAGLVVLVLIAYLIGRRKSRARGYQSV